MIHEIKISREHYESIIRGEKTSEIRINDRNYKVGDILALKPIRDDGTYYGLVIYCGVSHVLKDFEGLAEGYVSLSLRGNGGDSERLEWMADQQVHIENSFGTPCIRRVVSSDGDILAESHDLRRAIDKARI
ncbi:DUF3850 domain-containing protein [Acetobacter sp. DmW_136]|uniref:DUF3850 domain-containing protein n=1 Tax=Acetobacter sp. DmW_136 TaxID=2591091 RepID=UPI0012399B0F|nr:DUF3850 domain-containing protein [Acetobacter sp. DmW_136]KAA8385130.1 DUF3850 domain-containing protein [Acetobacter sp. DmW_136]